MKRSLLLALGLCFWLGQFAYAQGGRSKPQPKVPPVVIEAFNARYPGLKALKWDFEAQKELYEVDFIMEGKEKEAHFSPAGKWQKTKMDITRAELPEAVAKAASEGDLAQWTMEDISSYESPKGSYYKIRFKKGEQAQSLKFDPEGNMLVKDKNKAKAL